MISISEFTGNDAYKGMEKVFSGPKGLYATDGRVAVRIKRSNLVSENENPELVRMVDDVFEKTKRKKRIDYYLAEMSPCFEKCVTCNGTGEITTCEQCSGEREYECPHCGQDTECEECEGSGKSDPMKCHDCEGSGKVETCIKVYLQENPYPVLVDGRYLIKIFNKFKDVKVYVTGGSDKPVYFKFGEGEALLMPMRPH